MAQIRATIESVRRVEGGLLLEVVVPWPASPQPPENLVKAPEEEKNEYHQRTIAFCDDHREVEKIRPGRVVLDQPEELLADGWKRYEEASWEAYQEALGEDVQAKGDHDAGEAYVEGH